MVTAAQMRAMDAGCGMSSHVRLAGPARFNKGCGPRGIYEMPASCLQQITGIIV